MKTRPVERRRRGPWVGRVVGAAADGLVRKRRAWDGEKELAEVWICMYVDARMYFDGGGGWNCTTYPPGRGA